MDQTTHKVRRPFNLRKWIEENKEFLKPPVGNRQIYEDADFIVMVVGGPNSRKDYHWEHGEELFYQIEGDITVRIQEEGKPVDIVIKQGDLFLLPPKIPHSPIRGPNTVGLVVERKRNEKEPDKLMWFCEQCNNKLFEKEFGLNNIVSQFQGIFKQFYESIELRTCKECQALMEPPEVYC